MYPKPNFEVFKKGYIAILGTSSDPNVVVDYFKTDPAIRLTEKPNTLEIMLCWCVIEVPGLREDLHKYLQKESPKLYVATDRLYKYKKDLFTLPIRIHNFFTSHDRSQENLLRLLTLYDATPFDKKVTPVYSYKKTPELSFFPMERDLDVSEYICSVEENIIEKKEIILEQLVADYRDIQEEFYEIYLKKYPHFFNNYENIIPEEDSYENIIPEEDSLSKTLVQTATIFALPFIAVPFLLGSLVKDKYDRAKKMKYEKESLQAWLDFARNLTVAEKKIHKKIASIFEQAENHNMQEHLMYELKDYDHSYISGKFEEVRHKYPKKSGYYPLFLINSEEWTGNSSIFFNKTILTIFYELGLFKNLKVTEYRKSIAI